MLEIPHPVEFAWLLPSAYFLGAIPFGLLIGLANGVDPRKAGSGNIGATNVGRLLGGKFFALVFLLDALKSLLPTLAAGWILRHGAQELTPPACLLWIATGACAVIGHMYPVFLGFRGGKGVATAAGVMFGLYPYYTVPAMLAIMLFIVVFYIWRYVSVASMAAAASLPIFYAVRAKLVGEPVLGPHWPLFVGAAVLAAMIVVRHRGNIRRLMNGTEQPFRRKREAA